jgi:hypothetical protein
MRLMPTRFRVWERNTKVASNGNEYADLFLSEKVTSKKSDVAKYNSLSGIAFGETAKKFSSVNKGDLIDVTAASLNIDEWIDKETGKKRYKAKVVVFDFEKVSYDKQ